MELWKILKELLSLIRSSDNLNDRTKVKLTEGRDTRINDYQLGLRRSFAWIGHSSSSSLEHNYFKKSHYRGS